MIRGYISNPNSYLKRCNCVSQAWLKTGENSRIRLPIRTKNWCKLTQGQILIQALEALELLSDEQQNQLLIHTIT